MNQSKERPLITRCVKDVCFSYCSPPDDMKCPGVADNCPARKTLGDEISELDLTPLYWSATRADKDK